jgi:hypothetical protein
MGFFAPKNFKSSYSIYMSKAYRTYEEFWPFYLSQHRNYVCRLLHFIGTHFVILFGFAGVLYDYKFLLLMPFMGYGFAWAGHFIFEKNVPATFTYPLWSLIGDFKMFFMTLGFKLKKEFDRLQLKSF